MLSIGNNKLFINNITNKYNNEIKNIMCANLKSVIAYQPSHKMKDYSYKYLKFKNINDLTDIRLDPLFYNGPHIRKNRTDVQGYMVYSNKSLYITFRGLNDVQDIMACIDIRRENLGDNIYIHKGYYDQFKSIEKNITTDIVRLCNSYEIDNLIFSGHSMGGAIATIAAPYYSTVFNGKKHISCYTFGTTMVGNDNFVDWFTKNVNSNYRIQAESDIIPLIPIHESYTHVPNNITISEDYFTNTDKYNKNGIDFLKDVYNEKKLITKLIVKHNVHRYLDIIYNAYVNSMTM